MPVTVHHGVDSFREACEAVRRGGRRLGLVPTMGALHEGHQALVREAARRSDVVAVTIFVNPTQFGPTEDLDRYPRDLEGDVAKCQAAGAELVFAPAAAAIYPAGERTRVRVDGLSTHLCGRSRPVHFEGVATVVTKLFAVAGPCVAVFGRKDYQQLRVVERLARDLLLPIEVVGHPTVREADGLALSSRNAYLSASERATALAIPRALAAAVRRFAGGERAVAALREPVIVSLGAAGLRVDYVDLATADTVQPLPEGGTAPAEALLAVAAFAGATRLIDNVVLGVDPEPAGSGAP
ncbi:MAG: pantoate--beta-alanine ligase [Polyangiaceae bacterium]|nr:pantoate--beta-alanine ligase [Polyangiaceae bacterium]